MNRTQFELLLDKVAEQLTSEMRANPASEHFSSALNYEQHVRESLHDTIKAMGASGVPNEVDLHPSGQTFPDVPCGEFGVEVKFTKSDKWVSIANSVRETQRVETVKVVYLMFGKMGGVPESRWKTYEECVVHVRTTHEPRFQVDMTGEKPSLFEVMSISYDEFRKLDIMDKMPYIRSYAKKIHPDGRLWWLGDSTDEHSTPVDLIPYPSLPKMLKARYRAEAVLLVPEVLIDGRGSYGSRKSTAYKDMAMYLMTCHGVLVYNARDLVTAGSVGNKEGVIDLQGAMENASEYLDDSLFKEYWGVDVAKADRLAWWLDKADQYASNWGYKPSTVMFLDYQRRRRSREK